MGLKVETWAIAYRKKEKGLLESNSAFKVIKNGHKGWYADPFLFDYQGKTYLFAEYFSYKVNRGVLVCSEYDEKIDEFSEFKTIITESYHLSYPFVFEYNNKFFILPESNKSSSLYLYEAVDFPYHWKRTKSILSNIRLVDTTLFEYKDELYGISMRIDDEHTELNNQMLLLKIDIDNYNASEIGVITNDLSLARPGGRVIDIYNYKFFVTQDCKEDYGKALNFLKADLSDIENISLNIEKKVLPNDIHTERNKKFAGIHTYNFSERFEVVDLKSYNKSLVRLFYRALRKFGFE